MLEISRQGVIKMIALLQRNLTFNPIVISLRTMIGRI